MNTNEPFFILYFSLSFDPLPQDAAMRTVPEEVRERIAKQRADLDRQRSGGDSDPHGTSPKANTPHGTLNAFDH